LSRPVVVDVEWGAWLRPLLYDDLMMLNFLIFI